MESYICRCGNKAFHIFSDKIECSKCGISYYLEPSLSPQAFNEIVKSYGLKLEGDKK